MSGHISVLPWVQQIIAESGCSGEARKPSRKPPSLLTPVAQQLVIVAAVRWLECTEWRTISVMILITPPDLYVP